MVHTTQMMRRTRMRMMKVVTHQWTWVRMIQVCW